MDLNKLRASKYAIILAIFSILMVCPCRAADKKITLSSLTKPDAPLSTGITVSSKGIELTCKGTIIFRGSETQGCGVGGPPDSRFTNVIPGGTWFIARVGNGPWQQVGNGPKTIQGTGELFLAVNDALAGPCDGNDCFSDNSGSFSIQAKTQSRLEGKITDSDGEGVPDVFVSAKGKKSKNATTDSNGKYVIDLDAGSYVAMPSKGAGKFKPESKSVSVKLGKTVTANFKQTSCSGHKDRPDSGVYQSASFKLYYNCFRNTVSGTVKVPRSLFVCDDQNPASPDVFAQVGVFTLNLTKLGSGLNFGSSIKPARFSSGEVTGAFVNEVLSSEDSEWVANVSANISDNRNDGVKCHAAVPTEKLFGGQQF